MVEDPKSMVEDPKNVVGDPKSMVEDPKILSEIDLVPEEAYACGSGFWNQQGPVRVPLWK